MTTPQQMRLTDENQIERRAQTYRLLSPCFHDPGEQLRDQLAAVSENNVRFDVDTLRTAATDLEQLRLDHTKLFVGPFEITASPYGSTYLDSSGQVMGESTADVKQWYRQEALEIDLNEPPDHVAAELEFVGVLAIAQREAAANGDAATATEYASKQYEFLSQHLGRWVSELAENMQTHAETEFYRVLGQETRSFVENDGKELAALLEEAEEGDEQASSEKR